jgi:hypothetical protein
VTTDGYWYSTLVSTVTSSLPLLCPELTPTTATAVPNSSSLIHRLKQVRPTVSRPIYLCVKPHLGRKTKFSSLSSNCEFSDVENLPSFLGVITGLSFQLLVAVSLLAESHGTHDTVLLSQIRDSSNPYLYHPGTGRSLLIASYGENWSPPHGHNCNTLLAGLAIWTD